MFLPPVPPLLLPRSTTFRDARKCARFEKFASNYGQNFREKRREGLSRVVFPFETSARHRRSRRRGKDRKEGKVFTREEGSPEDPPPLADTHAGLNSRSVRDGSGAHPLPPRKPRSSAERRSLRGRNTPYASAPLVRGEARASRTSRLRVVLNFQRN